MLKPEEVWFNYVKENKKLWTNGMTLNRLDKIKDVVFADEDVMFDLLHRHNAKDNTPEQMKADSKEWYDHCIGNFVCSIHYKMMHKGMIKG